MSKCVSDAYSLIPIACKKQPTDQQVKTRTAEFTNSLVCRLCGLGRMVCRMYNLLYIVWSVDCVYSVDCMVCGLHGLCGLEDKQTSLWRRLSMIYRLYELQIVWSANLQTKRSSGLQTLLSLLSSCLAIWWPFCVQTGWFLAAIAAL